MAMIVMVFIMIANCIVQCDMGCMCKTTKWRLKPFWVRVLCLLHCLQHWLHGLATLVTNFVGVGPIFKISAAKCISSFWKDYWYYSCYPYYSYYRNKSPTSIRAINPSTPFTNYIFNIFNEAIKFFANSKFFYHLYLYKKIMLYVVLQQNILYFVPTIGVWRVFYGTRSAASSGGF